MIQGAKKISELTSTTLNGSEVVPVVQDDGLGNLTTFKVLASSLGTDTNFANTDLTLTANRTHDLAGYNLAFNNGTIGASQSSVNPTINATNSGSGSGVVGTSTSSNGVSGVSTSGNGVSGSSINSNGVTGASVNSKGGAFRNQVLVEEYSTANEVQEASSLFEVKSTVKGALLPRMTTTQRNAISSPATGLEIYNTTTGRKEVYNGSYWQGVATRFIQVQHSSWSPADGQTVAFGAHPYSPVQATISPPPYEIIMRGNGVIRGCDFDSYASATAGSNEAWSLYVRHNGTDYLVQTVGTAAAVRKFSNQSLNIPYVDGDIVRMIFVNPTWATNPTLVVGVGFLRLL